MKNKKTEEAVTWYEKAIEDKQDAETYYRYAQMLKSNGKYKEANIPYSTTERKRTIAKWKKKFSALYRL